MPAYGREVCGTELEKHPISQKKKAIHEEHRSPHKFQKIIGRNVHDYLSFNLNYGPSVGLCFPETYTTRRRFTLKMLHTACKITKIKARHQLWLVGYTLRGGNPGV